MVSQNLVLGHEAQNFTVLNVRNIYKIIQRVILNASFSLKTTQFVLRAKYH
jgi:hypothetical protein